MGNPLPVFGSQLPFPFLVGIDLSNDPEYLRERARIVDCMMAGVWDHIVPSARRGRPRTPTPGLRPNTALIVPTNSNTCEQTLISPLSSYQGNLQNPNNHSAPIPTSMSTSVFISELPANTTIHDVLDEIHDCGKIWASNIIPAQGSYITRAAKIVFWDCEGRERFVQRWQEGNFVVGGRLPKVVMNDYHSAPKAPSPASRVIKITGPTPIINEGYLRRFFSANFKYDIDEVLSLWCSAGIGTDTDTVRLEVRFSSYRAQAAAAWKWIQTACLGNHVPNVTMTPMEQFFWRGVSITWGNDPCEL